MSREEIREERREEKRGEEKRGKERRGEESGEERRGEESLLEQTREKWYVFFALHPQVGKYWPFLLVKKY